MDNAPESMAAFTLGLRRVRRARRLALALFVGFVPYMLVCSRVGEPHGLTWLWYLAPYVVAWGWIGFQMRQTRCPRCGRLFFLLDDRRVHTFTSQCMNCGLSVAGSRDGPHPPPRR